jgi:hypothetical protein
MINISCTTCYMLNVLKVVNVCRKCRDRFPDSGNPEINPGKCRDGFPEIWKCLENRKSRKCPRELQEMRFRGFKVSSCSSVYREIPQFWGVFRTNLDFGNSGKCPDGFPYATNFSQGKSRGFQFFRGFTAVATYKICKISRFWVFSGTDFPDFRKFRIPEIRDTFCAFRNFRDFGNPDPEKPCFHRNRSAQQVFWGDFEWGFRGFREISGTLSKNFRKISEPEIQIWHFFFGCFSCFRV